MNGKFSAFDDAVFVWITPTRHEKGWLWFVIAGLIFTGFVVYGLSTNDWTFSLAVLVFAGVYILFDLNHPKETQVKISPMGIKIGAEVFPFTHLKCFWIHYDPPRFQSLNFRVSKKFHPEMSIFLPHGDPSGIREYLAAQVPEWEGKSESLTHTLQRVLKF